MRKLMNRYRRAKPELKFVAEAGTVNILAGPSTTTINITSLAVVLGPTQFQRIGNQIMLRKCVLKSDLQVSNNPANLFPDFWLRAIIWTPRVDAADANSYLNTVGFNSILDFKILNTFYDKKIRMGAVSSIVLAPIVAPVPNYPTWPSQARLDKTFLFPRSVKFTDLNNLMNPNKDVMYITFINESAHTFLYDFVSRITFTDM